MDADHDVVSRFGIGIGMGNMLNTTVAAFRGIFGGNNTGTNMGQDSMGNPNPFNDDDAMFFTPLNYDFDMNGVTNNADLTAMANAVVPLVERTLEPFDIEVAVGDAANLADAVDAVGENDDDATGEFDAYIFVTNVTSDDATLNVPGGLFGRAALRDLAAQTGNQNDEAALTFANNVFNSTPGTQGTAAFNANLAQRLAYTSTHEAFHTFSYLHTPDELGTMPQASANQRLLASGDVIRRGSNTRDNPFIVTRYDLLRGIAVGEPNNYLLAANDADIGLRDDNGNNTPDLAYATGTGANDQISFTDGGGGIVNVAVDPYSDQGRTLLIGAGETYSIDLGTDTDGEILVDASINADEVIIDATISTDFRARGGIGADSAVSATADQDLLTLNSGGLTGTFTPGPDGINGSVSYGGGANVNFSEFEDVEADNVPIEVAPLTLSSNSIDEDDIVDLSGEFVNIDTRDTHTVTIDWGDGTPDTVLVLPTGERSFMTSHHYLDDDPTETPSDNYTIRVTVEDEDDDSGETETVVTVNNVDPELSNFASDATFEDKAEEGEPVTVTASFADPGTLDTHTAIVDWGDGSALESIAVNFAAGVGTIEGSHAYAAGGIYTITVMLTDDDTGSDMATTTAVVTGIGLNNGILYIIGSSEDDEVSVNQTGNGSLKVRADFVAENFRSFDVGSVEKIISYLCEGEDHVAISNRVVLPAIIHGGADNDHLNAGGGPTVLLGDEGDDELVGQFGDNILIGGLGFDKLTGGKASDVLIGGTTSLDSDDDALMDAAMDWSADGEDYDDRVDAVDMVLAVFDDGNQDKLTGSSSQDLFYEDAGDELTDVMPNETVL